MAIKVNEITSWVAEVLDFEGSLMTSGEKLEIEQAFRSYHVLVLRDQTMTASQLSEFSRKLGPLEQPINTLYLHPESSDVLILSNEIRPDGTAVGVVDGGDGWHSDSSHQPEPAKATILQSIKKPDVGGDTLYCNMHMVFDALPETTRSKVVRKFGVNNVSKVLNPRVKISDARPDAKEFYQAALTKYPSVLQPLVRTHPETGRQSLYCSPRFTIGIQDMDDTEAQPLLDELFEFIYDEKFQYRHTWSANDMVIWDNRCLNHKATGNLAPGDIRRMHRTVLRGDSAYYDPEGRPRRQ